LKEVPDAPEAFHCPKVIPSPEMRDRKVLGEELQEVFKSIIPEGEASESESEEIEENKEL
jgi:hypothetical protein